MNETMTEFELNQYLHLPQLLNKNSCDQLVLELQKLIDEGKTTKDSQCPLSEAVHGAPIFDDLLEQLTPFFEKASGKKLYPTYAYARLYSTPGEELKVHTDRPSCEISATLTLGFEGNVWPIYMGNEDKNNASKIEMGVGDAVLYRGMDKHHWREPYKEGKWQAQVFLHYVDANGPYAEWKYDKRSKLSHHEEPSECNYWYFLDAMTPDAARKFFESIEAQTPGERAKIGSGNFTTLDTKIRDVNKVILPSYRGIGATMTGLGLAANYQAWKFNVTHSNQTEYLKYDINGHYEAHIDTFFNSDTECRKLTVLMFLNDDFEGGKFFIRTGEKKIYPHQAPGTCIVFPSFLTHGVEPVTKGIRRSVVTWLVGPWFK